MVLSSFLTIYTLLDAFLLLLNSNFIFTYALPILDVFSFFNVGFQWTFYFDYLTLVMYGLITIITTFIFIFSFGYMSEDASAVRFLLYLIFFMVSMQVLVGSSNFLQLFFGWELVGLASFLLINFWFSRQDANMAAYKAVAVNRFGDCFLLLSIFIFFFVYNTIEFDLILALVEATFLAKLAFIFLILACFAKSAQFFFHGWLPDAMEGPTPVSALLHSATMVTAGVFVALRFIDLMALFSDVRFFVVFVSLLTALYSMSLAAVADDTKRVTAYTTLNQLGFMFFGCASLATATVLFHLIVHGFYKSFTFLSAAIELHNFEDEQDGEYDNLDDVSDFEFFDIFTSLVYFSINAIPFTSPSISKEFMLLSGSEMLPNYFFLIVLVVLFANPIDEGRSDISDHPSSHSYVDDVYFRSSSNPFISFSCFSLGTFSIFSATFLEEFFIDMKISTSVHSSWDWILTQSSILIFLPFIIFVFSELDNSRFSKQEDFNHSSLFPQDSRYRSLLFNADLWHYDYLITFISSKFLKFSYYLNQFYLDRGYLEYLFVALPFKSVQYFSSFYYIFLEIGVFFSVVTISLSFICFFNFPWFFIGILLYIFFVEQTPSTFWDDKASWIFTKSEAPLSTFFKKGVAFIFKK
jgi:NADH:ubiquinone oxidoreductase subunit 5 (subunit L)/multisubunit Na+/H+ antiporter MnhA subunit